MFQQSLVTGEVPAEGLQVVDPGGLSARPPNRGRENDWLQCLSRPVLFHL